MKTAPNHALIRYPVPIGKRTAYIELPRSLTAADVKRIHAVMLTLIKKR